MSEQKHLNDLPESKDEYWESAETHSYKAERINICETHGRETWLKHNGYREEEGYIKCEACPWGTKTPPHIRVKDGKAVDVRLVD